MRSFLLFAISVCCASACSVTHLKGQDLIGAPAPEARLMLLDGSEIPVSAQQGKYTPLLFWATWCAHSKSIIIEFEDLARRYAHRSDIEFIAVSIDKNEDFQTLKDRIRYQGLTTIKHIFSGNDVLDDAFINFKGEHVPYVVLIDPSGIVRLVDTRVGSLDEYLHKEFGT